MKEVVETQRRYFDSNTTKNTDFRIAQLKKLRSLIKENESGLNDAIYRDFKKSAFETYSTELFLLYQEISLAVKNLKNWSAPKPASTSIFNFPATSYIIPEPLGVSLIISPWNYPIQLAISPVIASIAAGNTSIIKPSEHTPHTSSFLARLINENFDPGFLKVVEGGVTETTELLNQKFDKIFFTGSPEIGKVVYAAAAKHLTPVTLELGGKSPAIITADCNLKMTVQRLIWAKFLNAGQTCIAPDYVLIDKTIKSEFLKLAQQEIQKAAYSFENNNYVQIINEKNMRRLIELMGESKIYCGGKYDVQQKHFEPTILTDVTFEHPVMQEEIFGPILPVLEFSNLDEAIKQIKSLDKPLACYVFTSSKSIRNKVLSEISFGGGAVNEAIMHISESSMPFGGVGKSGTGSYHGEFGFRAFSHYKSIMQKPTWFESGLKYAPYSDFKLKLVKYLSRFF